MLLYSMQVLLEGLVLLSKRKFLNVTPNAGSNWFYQIKANRMTIKLQSFWRARRLWTLSISMMIFWILGWCHYLRDIGDPVHVSPGRSPTQERWHELNCLQCFHDELFDHSFMLQLIISSELVTNSCLLQASHNIFII